MTMPDVHRSARHPITPPIIAPILLGVSSLPLNVELEVGTVGRGLSVRVRCGEETVGCVRGAVKFVVEAQYLSVEGPPPHPT